MGLLSHKARQAPPKSTAVYVRHRPMTTLLYQIVQAYWPEFQAALASHGRHLPTFILTPDAVNASDDDPSSQLLGSSITYRIALGPQRGRKVFTLQTLPDLESDNPFSSSVGEVAGFSLHAGVATKANERAKLERLCRYITRSALT